MRRIATLAISVLFVFALPLVAQQVPPGGLSRSQIETLRRNPELVRQQIQQSGLTPDQIRDRLRAAGYPDTLLNAYMPGLRTAPAPSTLGPEELSAIQALGLPFVTAAGLLPLDTGFVTQPAESSRVFGVEAFRRTTTQFLPVLSGPVPPDYTLGPGDVLVLILTGDVELAHTLTVTRDGFILIPQVGQLFVANLTLDQLRSQLYTRLGRVYSGVRRGAGATTRFDVSVANVRANQVYVVGEVMQPGAYQISALGTVLTGLYAAGGVTERANMRHIEVRRRGEVAATLDLYDYLLHGNVLGDVRLETGDVVFVPVYDARVDVSGSVVRPGIYELVAGDGLADILGAAGGFLPDADLRSVTIHRIMPAGERGPGPAPRAAISVALIPDSTSLAKGGVSIPAFALRDGDSVVVDSLPALRNGHTVTISGMVLRTGTYPWREGITLRDLVRLAGGPRVGADLRQAEIARMPADREGGALADTLRARLDSSYIMDRDAAGRFVGPPGPTFPPAGSAPEYVLQPYDRVLILKQPEFEFQRPVTILGEVYLPGTYTLTRKDARISDLVARAGGLLSTAFPEGARFIRPFGDAGRVNIRLEDALTSPGGANDLILQPDDSLTIPEYVPTVHVFGAVIAPGSFQWVAGKGADFYLENAGGVTENGDKGRTVVRYANGSARNRGKFLFWSHWPEPGPGSDVYVPTKTPREATNWVPVLAAVASILASTASVVIAVTR